MFTVEEVCEEQERQYNQLMQEDDQYCHPESFKWGFEHGLDYALTKVGWHPASKLPPVDENGNSPELIAITWDGYLMRAYFHQESEEYSFWVESDDWNKQAKYGVNVKWWSYPPEED